MVWKQPVSTVSQPDIYEQSSGLAGLNFLIRTRCGGDGRQRDWIISKVLSGGRIVTAIFIFVFNYLDNRIKTYGYEKKM